MTADRTQDARAAARSIAKLCETLHQHAMLGGPKAREVGYKISDADLLLAAENALRNRAAPTPSKNLNRGTVRMETTGVVVPAPTPDADAFKIDALNGALSLCQSERDEAREQAGQLAEALRALLGYCDNCGGSGFIDDAKTMPCRWCTPARAALASFDASTKGTT